MSNKYINLPSAVKIFIEGSLTDMLGESIFGKQCILHLPPIPANCPNCIPDPIGLKSSGQYLPGGPQFFTNGQICPVCFGNYIIESQNDIIIDAAIEFKFEYFLDILKRNIRYPQNTIQIRTYTNNIDHLMNCSHLETLLDVPNAHYNYKLLGEPIVPGKFTEKFCYSAWERI